MFVVRNRFKVFMNQSKEKFIKETPKRAESETLHQYKALELCNVTQLLGLSIIKNTTKCVTLKNRQPRRKPAANDL
jgi:hypothetical protein